MDVPLGINATREVVEIEDSESDSERKLEDNVANPSVTIAREFEAAVKEGFTFDGNFAFSERYTMRDAANPCLKIDGIGTVGLPLGERVALAIISVAEPADIDSASSIWEVPAEKGHHFQEGRDLSETKIAALVVVLPSSFEGGQLQLRHGLETKSVELAHHSAILNSAVAAYVGVWHSLSSVTSGYHLSLVYDINQPVTDTQVRRSLPETDGPAQNLSHVLQRWKDGRDPDFLACLLRHTYTVEDDENFDTQLLYGADGQLVSQLIPLVRELDFRACFAQVTLTVTSSASAEHFARNRHSGYTRYDDSESDDSIDENEFEINGDEKEEKFRVLKVVDLSGMPIDVKIGLKTRHGTVQELASGGPDDEEFEKYDRTSGRIKETYNRTVLLLWLKGGSMESEVKVGDICDYVSHALRDSNSAAPTARETELVDMLAESCKLRRRDEKKLQRVVQVLSRPTFGMTRSRVEGFVSAYQRFGWDFFETAMKHDESNRRRQVLLQLSKIAAEDNNSEIASWCKAQQENVLRYLSKLDAKQLPWLMEASRPRGAEFLRDVVFPQLRSQNLDRLFWIPFLRVLQENVELVPKFSPDIVEGLIVQCFSESARTLPPFPTKTPKPKYRGQTVYEEADCEPFLEVLNLLVQNNHADLSSPAMRDAKQRATYKLNCPPWQYYTKLLPILIRMIQSSTTATAALSAAFQPFFVDAVESMISPPPPNPNIRSWDKPTSTLVLDSEKLRTFRAAARMSGGLSVVKSSLITAKLDRQTSSCLQGLARAISEEFRRETSTSPDYSVLMTTLARAAVDAFDTSSPIPRYTNDSLAERMINFASRLARETNARIFWTDFSLRRRELPPKSISPMRFLHFYPSFRTTSPRSV
ncbi:hypothetical protein MVEN_02365500 [Mycena venus]|uniref:Uncharacterized protein n=1 Tax=Mycena venus TaxID=2733690 RepID=A0A8H7CFG0_9AGAR|nr:hypothetical protein MVEN_02365500 [Mycena venus]